MKTFKILVHKIKNAPITVKATISYTVCNILQRCISFITLPLFTRILTTEQYGQSTVYNSWIGLFSILITLNLAYGSFGPAMMKYEKDRDGYIASVQGICLLLGGIFVLIYYPFSSFWNKILDLPTALVLLLVIDIITSTSTLLWSGKQRYAFKYKAIIAVTLSATVLGAFSSYVLVKITATEKGYARIVGNALPTILIGAFIFIVSVKKGHHLFNKTYWKYALSYNIPLLAYYFSQMIFNQSDRLMINHLCGTSEAAKYGVAYTLAMVLTFVLNAINGSYVPWMYAKIKEGRGEENKTISIALVVLMGLMILCVIWFAPEIIMIMAGEQYEAAIYVVAPVAMSLLLLFYCQLFINVEFYYEEKKMLVYGSVGAAMLNIVLNYLLIPVFGFVVAGYTTLASYIVFALSNCTAMRLMLKRRNLPDNMYDYKSLLVLLIVFMIVGFMGVALYGNLVVRVFITFFVLILLVLKRDRLIDALKSIKER